MHSVPTLAAAAKTWVLATQYFKTMQQNLCSQSRTEHRPAEAGIAIYP